MQKCLEVATLPPTADERQLPRRQRLGWFLRESGGVERQVQRVAGRQMPTRPTRSQHHGYDEDDDPKARRHVNHDAHLH